MLGINCLPEIFGSISFNAHLTKTFRFCLSENKSIIITPSFPSECGISSLLLRHYVGPTGRSILQDAIRAAMNNFKDVVESLQDTKIAHSGQDWSSRTDGQVW